MEDPFARTISGLRSLQSGLNPIIAIIIRQKDVEADILEVVSNILDTGFNMNGVRRWNSKSNQAYSDLWGKIREEARLQTEVVDLYFNGFFREGIRVFSNEEEFSLVVTDEVGQMHYERLIELYGNSILDLSQVGEDFAGITGFPTFKDWLMNRIRPQIEERIRNVILNA